MAQKKMRDKKCLQSDEKLTDTVTAICFYNFRAASLSTISLFLYLS